MANRVASAISKVRENPNLARLEGTMGITLQEKVAYQQAQSAAFASEKLTLEEAQLVYRALGEGGGNGNEGWAAGTDLATKVVVTKLMGELML